MDTRQWHQEIRALHSALVTAEQGVTLAAEKVSAARGECDSKRKALAECESNVRTTEDKIAGTDLGDLDHLRECHTAVVACRVDVEVMLADAAKALAERKREHKVARLARAEAQARLDAFRRGQPYQPELPGTGASEAQAKIEVVAPKRKDIEAAMRSSESLAAAAEQLKIPTATLKQMVAARGIDLGILGSELPAPAADLRMPPRRTARKGGATA